MAESKQHIFLCYASQDRAFARGLYDTLRGCGFMPWLDERDLLPGQDWELEVRKAIRNSRIVIVCLSRSSSNKRGFVQKEITYALDTAGELPAGAIFIIPLKIEDCDVPERLRHLQWLNYCETGAEGKLIAMLERVCGAAEEPPSEYGYVCYVLGTQDRNADFSMRIGRLDGLLARYAYKGVFRQSGCADPVYRHVFFFSKAAPDHAFHRGAEEAGCNLLKVDEYVTQKMVDILKLEM